MPYEAYSSYSYTVLHQFCRENVLSGVQQAHLQNRTQTVVRYANASVPSVIIMLKVEKTYETFQVHSEDINDRPRLGGDIESAFIR